MSISTIFGGGGRRNEVAEPPGLEDRRTYYQYVCAELRNVGPIQNQQLKTTVDEILAAKDLDTLEWRHVYCAERALIEALPEEALREKAWDIRARYLHIAPADFRGLVPPEPDGEKKLKAHLGTLLQETYWLYRNKTSWEEQREWFGRKFLAALPVIAAVVAIPPIAASIIARTVLRSSMDWGWLKSTYVLLLAAAIGALGGFVSLLQRFKTVPASYTDDLLELQPARKSVLAQAVLLGAIFALVALAMFGGKIVSGAVFPTAPDSGSFTDFLVTAVYGNGSNLAKVVFWSFAAGFAERLVPDMIDRATKTPNVAVLVPRDIKPGAS